MKESNTKIWLPDNTDLCNEPGDECRFLLNQTSYCLLLNDVLSSDRQNVIKHEDCPAKGK